MDEILVEGGLGAEPVFKSLHECISHTSGDRELRSVETSNAIAGTTVVSVAWKDYQTVSFELDGGQTLSVFCDGGIAEWSLGSGRMDQTFVREDRLVVRAIGGGAKGRPIEWAPAELLKARIGKKLMKVFAGTALFYVYFDAAPILLFWPRRFLNRTGVLLHFSDTD